MVYWWSAQLAGVAGSFEAGAAVEFRGFGLLSPTSQKPSGPTGSPVSVLLVANGVEHFELEGIRAGLVGDSVTTPIMQMIDNLYRRVAGVAPRCSKLEGENI